MQDLTIPQHGAAQPEKAARRLDSILVYGIAGWSGYFVMSTELLAGRIVAPFFGGSIYVWGAVITVFMLALALGYLVGGRLSLRNPGRRRLGALLAVAALSALPVVLFGAPILEGISDRVPDPRYGTLLACVALFFLPTFLSGMVSPYAVRLLVTQTSTSGASAGWLYFVSTFGSAAGTIITSFYLVLLLEVNQIILIMVSLSVVIGALPLLARSSAS
jgi:MFS family permease